MTTSTMIHLAIPAMDLKASKDFYETLGGITGRKYPDSVVMYFYDCQLVLHKCKPEKTLPLEMYPRHFGVILSNKEQLSSMWNKLKESGFVFAEYFTRHEDKFEEHHTFFLYDPSNNVIEFKWYKNQESIFNASSVATKDT